MTADGLAGVSVVSGELWSALAVNVASCCPSCECELSSVVSLDDES